MSINIQKLTPWNWHKKDPSTSHHAAHHSALTDRIQSRNYGMPANFISGGLGEGNPLQDLHRDIDRLFGDAFSSMNMFPNFAHTPMFGEVALKPQLDIAETDKSYNLSVEMAGVDEKDITLEVSTEGLLTITGEKKAQSEKTDKNFHSVERSYGTFKRVLALPEDASADNIEATFKNGVLEVTLPKKALEEPEGTKVINIKSAA